MKNQLDLAQIEFYRTNGFVVIEDFLNAAELEIWRETVTSSIKERNGQKMPGKSVLVGEDDGINADQDYYSKVFEQVLNLWQTNSQIETIMKDERIGKMAAELAEVDGIRIWHDQALIKRPWANPTSWHLDTPFWSFFDKKAISIWVALDDATLENGCLFFIPGSHKKTTFKNPGIGKNMDSVFDFYPEFKQFNSISAPMKAGSCSFHCGQTIHGAHANMTPGSRRAMACAYMPDGNVFNGQANILPPSYMQKIKVGDLLNNENQNPLIYKR